MCLVTSAVFSLEILKILIVIKKNLSTNEIWSHVKKTVLIVICTSGLKVEFVLMTIQTEKTKPLVVLMIIRTEKIETLFVNKSTGKLVF